MHGYIFALKVHLNGHFCFITGQIPMIMVIPVRIRLHAFLRKREYMLFDTLNIDGVCIALLAELD